MKYLEQLKKKEEGFTLVELIVVSIIMAILCQIGFVSFNRFTRQTRALAARTVLRNIKSECEMNRDLGKNETFTPLTPSGYSIQTANTNSCLGEAASGLVSIIPKRLNLYPSYFYDHSEGKIECSYNNASDNLFKDCISLKSRLESNLFVIKDTYMERGCSSYVWVDGPKWEDAQANARRIGGNLATINDEEENKYLIDNFRERALSPNNIIEVDSLGIYNLFIGLKRGSGTGVKSRNAAGYYDGWVSGEKSDWRPPYWGPGGHGSDSDGNYTSISSHAPDGITPGGWNDFPSWQHDGVGVVEIPISGCEK